MMYYTNIRIQLVNFAFCSIDQRRVIARVGDKGHFCYMVFSGSLFVNIQEKDEITGKHCYKTKTILTEGNLFGVCQIH